jgi:hypothetical protein
MFEMFSNLWKGTYIYLRPIEWLFFGLLCATLFLVYIGIFVEAWPFYSAHTWLFFCLPWVFLCLTFFRPVARMSQERGPAVAHYLVAWSILGLLTFVITLYAVVTNLSTLAVTQEQKDLITKLQGLPAIIIPVWIAAIGWFLQVQGARKAQRTQNSFAFIMQTRTSGEFSSKARALLIVYPPGIDVPAADSHYFPAAAFVQLGPKMAEFARESTDANRKQKLEDEIRRIEGIDALRYMLNLYEFMAQGIRAGDLDEDLLYETVAYVVISLYERSKAFIENRRKEDVLVFEHIEELVHRWRLRINADEKRVKDAA